MAVPWTESDDEEAAAAAAAALRLEKHLIALDAAFRCGATRATASTGTPSARTPSDSDYEDLQLRSSTDLVVKNTFLDYPVAALVERPAPRRWKARSAPCRVAEAQARAARRAFVPRALGNRVAVAEPEPQPEEQEPVVECPATPSPLVSPETSPRLGGSTTLAAAAATGNGMATFDKPVAAMLGTEGGYTGGLPPDYPHSLRVKNTFLEFSEPSAAAGSDDSEEEAASPRQRAQSAPPADAGRNTPPQTCQAEEAGKLQRRHSLLWPPKVPGPMAPYMPLPWPPPSPSPMTHWFAGGDATRPEFWGVPACAQAAAPIAAAPVPPAPAPKAAAAVEDWRAAAMAASMSVGSAGHHLGQCRPCAFVHVGGCANGVNCTFCHLCGPVEGRKRHQAERPGKPPGRHRMYHHGYRRGGRWASSPSGP